MAVPYPWHGPASCSRCTCSRSPAYPTPWKQTRTINTISLPPPPPFNSLGHDLLHILGIQLGIALLLLAGHVHGHELDLDVAEALGQGQPEQVHGARSGPGPGERVVAIRVANDNRLDGHAGKEGAQLEANQRLAVRAGALGEDEQRWPVVGGIGTVLDRLDCRVARVGVFATHVDRLREVNDLWKERKR